jgi:hypothetical protein
MGARRGEVSRAEPAARRSRACARAAASATRDFGARGPHPRWGRAANQ